jgi:ABC-2 type transport system ATP-binding protein
MPETLIETQALVKQYGKFVAVKDVNFDVRGGEVFGFLGPNGAGKTTTIKMIVGLLQPTSGLVKVAGYGQTSEFACPRMGVENSEVCGLCATPRLPASPALLTL